MNKLFSLLFLCFLLLFSSVQADEHTIIFDAGVIENPSPKITVTYDASDAPLIIDTNELQLYYDFGAARNPVLDQNDQQVFDYAGQMIYNGNSPGLGAYDQYEFQINKFLPDGDYVLIIEGNQYDSRAENNRGKEHSLEVQFRVSAESMDIWVSEPRIPFIQPATNQDVAVGNQDLFDLVLETQYATVCTIQREPTRSLSLEEYFANGDKFNGGNPLPSTRHQILVADQSNTQFQGDDTVLSVVGEFTYQTYDRNANYLVVCRQEQANGNALFHQKILYVGYDTTAPNINVTFQPALIVDPNDMSTYLNITSDEDFMACNYRFTQQPPSSISGKNLPTSPVWLSNQFSGIADYTLDIFEEFPMGNGLIGGSYAYALNTAYEFSSEIVCQNLAGLESTRQTGFIVELDENLEFTIINDGGFTLYEDYHNYTVSSPEIYVQTNLLSTCEYLYEGVSTLVSEEPTREHRFVFDQVDEDIYGAEVLMRCQIPFSDTYYEESFFIAKDNTPPNTPELSPVFVGNEFTCDGSITLEIKDPQNDFTTIPYGEGGDRVRYEFGLYEGNQLLTTGETEFFSGASLLLNEEAFAESISLGANDFDKDYVWEIVAIDGVGQRSTPARFTVQRLHPDNPRCDTQAPTGSHDALLGPTGYEVRFSCVDPEGNCATSLMYAQLPLGSSCQDAELSTLSLTNTLNFNEDALLCYQFFDVAQPDNQFSPLYEVEITPEVNIEFTSPISGISSQKIFDFDFTTPSRNERSLTCRHGPVSVAAENLFSQRDYAGLYALSFLEEVADSNGREHTIPFNPSSTSVIGTQFDQNLETDIQEWMIVCKEAGVEVYPVRFFDFGFDTTPPSITYTVEPNLVENPLDLTAQLDITLDEESFCEFTDLATTPSMYQPLGSGIFELFSTYELSYQEQINYSEQQVLDVESQVRCYNKAGLSSIAQANYRVEAKGDLDIVFELDDFYETQYLDLVARTPGQWADCEISINGTEYVSYNQRTGEQSLDYVHEHRVTLEDGAHQLQTKCSAWFNSEVGYVTQDIIIDTTDPTIDIQVKSPSCSLDTITATIVTDGTGSSLVEQRYELYSAQDELITQGDLTDFIFELRNLDLTLGEEVRLVVYVEDQVGRNTTQEADILIATQENVACDITPPQSSLQVVDVYGGVELSVGCSDQETSCTDSFYYYFDETGQCLFDNPEQVQIGKYSDDPLLATQSSTFCYYVVDEGLNPSLSQSQPIDLILSCYNGIFDTTEEGVDCGGNCALQDCNICRNGAFDEAWEESTDCGGVCSAICSDGGFIPLSIELISPQHGVSPTSDFTFEIQTNRQAVCRLGKYNSDLGLTYQELYAQMRSLDYQQEFQSNFNGQEHALEIQGDVFAGTSGLDSYLEQAIIICREFEDYIPLVIPYFGFDSTAPVVQVEADPNPVTDPSLLASQLSVTTDDLSVCKFTNRETGLADFFIGEDYFDQETYRTQRDTTLNYWAEDALDDVQEISCTNLAGTTTQDSLTIEVRPEYSQNIDISNDGIIYSEGSGRILLEVNTSLYATCSYRLDDQDDFVEMDLVNPLFGLQGNIALATQHERQIFVEDGDYDVEIECNVLYDWFSPEYAVASFIQDSTLPEVELTLYDLTCSLDSLQAGIAATDATTDIVEMRYDVEVGGEFLRENFLVEQPWNEFNIFIDLEPYQGSQLAFTLYVTDEAGNTRQVRRTSRISSNADPQCDFVAPTGTYELVSVWQGYELQVTCEDNQGGSGCASDYQYSFQETGCADLLAPWPLRTPQLITESGTICAQVFDLRPNFGPLYTEDVVIVEENCFNYQWDPNEEGVDCGGVCDIACSNVPDLCENGVQDNFEEGVDCGGVCQDIRSCSGCTGPNCDVSCENGIADFNEEGIDCGGVCSTACPIVVDDADLALILPPFEVASTPDFILEVRTLEQATCRHGFLANARPNDVDDWYLTLDDFDLTNGRTHSTQIRSSQISQLDQNEESSSTSWVVICQAGDTYYTREMTSFGFDTTPAELQVSLTPDTLVDPGNMVTTLEVLSNEPVACTYQLSNGASTYFPTSDISIKDGYARDHNTELEYWGQDQIIEEYQVICRNLAQSISRSNVTLTVALTDDIGIRSHLEDVYNSNRVDLNFSTQQLATCRFRFNETAAYDDFGVSTTYEHLRTLNLDEGDHTIEVSCTSDSTGETAVLFEDFFIDTESPTLELVLSSSTCGLDDYTFTVQADGTGSDIDRYEYELLDGSEVLLSRSTDSQTIDVDYEFEEGTSYRLSVTAYDEAGNSREVVETIRAEAFDPLTCDENPPVGSIDISPRWNGYDVTIDCFDDNNCSENFDYLYSDGGVCEENYRVESYTNLPLAVTESTTLCYTVYDEAGNTYDGVEDISYEPACFNGIEDPSEEGIDCGGTCLAECGTCSNLIKDTFEEGLDCGGVCEHIRSCSDIAGLYDEFIDSDNDGLDDSWEEFYFGDLDEIASGDPDQDGLENIQEYLSLTDPTKTDTDEDGLDDLWEITFFGDQEQNPQDDPDNDTLTNLIEYALDTDPTTYDITDIDQDGLADQWEQFYFDDLNQTAEEDFDGDGLTNLEEYVFNTNPKVYTEREECEVDADCNYGFTCDFTFTCVIDETLLDDIFEEVEPGVNIVGIILLILGILFMGAGIGYIIYSRKQFKKTSEKITSRERAKQQKLLSEQRKKEEQRKAQSLAAKKAAQEKARKEKLQKRKAQRSQVLGSFANKTPSPKQTTSTQTTSSSKRKPKKPSKLDDGITDEFVDVRDLGKGKKKEAISRGIPKKIVEKSQENVFDSLSKISKKKKK